LGRVEEWVRASDAWRECLHESPRIEYFSHREAQSLHKQFRTFSSTSRDTKVLSLAEIVAEFQLVGFCASVRFKLFAGRNGIASLKTVGSRAYDWGFFAATSGVLQYMDAAIPTDEKVDFVFDVRGELSQCIATYNALKTSRCVKGMSRAGECTPGDDKQFAALQMADLLAWECSNSVRTRVMTGPFDVIIKRNRVVHIPCVPPPLFEQTLALQRMGVDVQRDAHSKLKRIYGDKEKSAELVNDVVELARQKASFDIQFEQLSSLYQMHDGYNKFITENSSNGDE
jgi:hypothetical protein